MLSELFVIIFSIFFGIPSGIFIICGLFYLVEMLIEKLFNK